MSEWQALRQAGWWSAVDYTMLTLIGFVWLTGAFWKIFGQPTALSLIALLLVNISIKLVWAIIVIFRCSRFVLNVTADIHLMPEAAARITLAYLTGKNQ